MFSKVIILNLFGKRQGSKIKLDVASQKENSGGCFVEILVSNICDILANSQFLVYNC